MSTSLPTPSVLAKKKELNLYAKNWVRNSHLANVAAILRTNSSLTFVGFRECCGVSDMGAVAIAASLGENSTLKKLNFESTKVGNKGVSALANAIGAGTNYTLYRLDLAYCKNNAYGGLVYVWCVHRSQYNNNSSLTVFSSRNVLLVW